MLINLDASVTALIRGNIGTAEVNGITALTGSTGSGRWIAEIEIKRFNPYRRYTLSAAEVRRLLDFSGYGIGAAGTGSDLPFG
jgi:hypothetical protein